MVEGLRLARIDWPPIMQKGVLPDHDWKECMIDDVLIPAVVVYFCTLVQLTHVQRISLIPTQLFASFRSLCRLGRPSPWASGHCCHARLKLFLHSFVWLEPDGLGWE